MYRQLPCGSDSKFFLDFQICVLRFVCCISPFGIQIGLSNIVLPKLKYRIPISISTCISSTFFISINGDSNCSGWNFITLPSLSPLQGHKQVFQNLLQANFSLVICPTMQQAARAFLSFQLVSDSHAFP